MKRTTMYAALMAATMILTGCGTPMERVQELTATMAANSNAALERTKVQAAEFRAAYDVTEGECGTSSALFIPYEPRIEGMTRRIRRRLADPINDAKGECIRLRSRVGGAVLGAENRAGTNPELIDTLVTGVVLRSSELNEEALGMLVDSSKSDEDAWRDLITALGQPNLAEGLTEAQHDAERAEYQAYFDETVSALEAQLEILAAEHVKWNALLAEVEAGRWSPPDSQ